MYVEVDSDTSREYGVNRKLVLTKLQYQWSCKDKPCAHPELSLLDLRHLIASVNSSRPTEISLSDDKLKQNGN